MLFRIVAPHFVAGIEPGVVAAPIIKYMLPWSEDQIRKYCKKKGWEINPIEEKENVMENIDNAVETVYPDTGDNVTNDIALSSDFGAGDTLAKLEVKQDETDIGGEGLEESPTIH